MRNIVQSFILAISNLNGISIPVSCLHTSNLLATELRVLQQRLLEVEAFAHKEEEESRS